MAGLGFAVDESSAFKNKQGKGQDLVGAIAGTDAVNKIAGSPAAATVGFLGEGATRGAALPIAATMDVLNKGVNAAGQFFGFNPGLSTDNTARVSNMSVPQSAAVPTTPPVNQAPAKAPAIAGPIAATTAAPKQQPVAPAPSTQQTVPAIAGVNSFSFNSKQPAGGQVANSSVSDFSPGSSNAQAIAGMSGVNVGPTPLTRTYSAAPGQQQTEQLGTLSNRGIAGLTYNEQVDRAKQVNEAGQRDLMQMSPRERAAAEVAGNANFGSFTRGGAKGDLAGYESRRSAIAGQLTDNQAQKIAGIKEQGDKYTADTNFKAHEITGKYNLAGHQATADATIAKAKQDQTAATAEKQQKDMKGVMDTYLKQWGSLNLPDSLRSNLHEFAKVHAYADANPDKAWIMNQSRDSQNAMIPRSINVGGKPVDTQALFRQLETQFGTKEASSRVLGMVRRAGGNPVNVPNWAAYPSMKQS